VIFSRKRGTSDSGKGSGRRARTRATGLSAADPYGDWSDDDTPEVPEYGPYDVTQAPEDNQNRIDLGALQIPVLADVDVQLETGPQGQIQRVQLSHAGSWLQLGAYAAPRTEGIWDDVREDVRSALVAGGAKPVEVQGEYGVELQARVRDPKGTVEVRHIGIDGPRWFVHGVYLGAAAVDPDRAGPLREVLRGVVVDRGTEARPVREVLPLRLPPEAAAQLAEMVAADAAGGAAQAASRESQAT
jgi:hypothetical protein